MQGSCVSSLAGVQSCALLRVAVSCALFLFLLKHLFIWPRQVLVAACGVFSLRFANS